MLQENDIYGPDYAVTDLRTGQLNSNERARLQIVLRNIERAYRLTEQRVDRYKQQLRRDLIDLEAHKAAMRSHALGYCRLGQLDHDGQREMLKVFSQRGRYNYSLKSEVNFHRECMSSYNARLEHAKKLLAASRKQCLRAIAKGDRVLSFGRDGEADWDTNGQAPDGFRRSETPPGLIVPRM
ncbi:uncharacterized protein LOC110985645 [Acanthaster planci]|uniref:Uncharacterized protein LOC110985645 n=1 Tax=Acanthaster planci TaxID=133434 RepID=A0A8B7ZA19_ACAPL|nr:uncharacterized protein LOC110985645 [Acanthaster planci]